MAKPKIPSIRVNHIYELYPLYQVIYGRGIESKAFEASKLSYMIQDVFRFYGKTWPLNIFEVLGGQSEHASLVKATGLPVMNYISSDLIENDASVNMDILKLSLPNTTNTVVGFYYSLGTILGQKFHYTTRDILYKALDNVFSQLRKTKDSNPKLVYFHLGDAPESNEYIYNRADLSSTHSFSVPYNNELYSILRLDPSNSITITCDIVCEYDRIRCVCKNHIENIKAVSHSTGEVVGKFVVKEPFVFRTWTEHEIMDIVNELGYKHIFLYNARIENYTFAVDRLSPSVEMNTEDYINTATTDFIVSL